MKAPRKPRAAEPVAKPTFYVVKRNLVIRVGGVMRQLPKGLVLNEAEGHLIAMLDSKDLEPVEKVFFCSRCGAANSAGG